MVNRRQQPQGGQHPQGQHPQHTQGRQHPQQTQGNAMRNCHVCKTTHNGSRKDHDETERHLMVLMTRNCRNLQGKVKTLEDEKRIEKRLNKNRYESMRYSINRLEREMDEINRYRNYALGAIMFIFICLILIR